MKRVVPWLAALLAAAPALAEPLAVGSPMPALELADQHGRLHSLGPSLRLLFFSRDMDGGRVVREALQADGAALLEQHRAACLSDVSGMPALVLRWMAKPSMRRRPYPVLLDEDGAATRGFPAREGHATVFFLEGGRVVRIEHVRTPAGLRGLLEEDLPVGGDG